MAKMLPPGCIVAVTGKAGHITQPWASHRSKWICDFSVNLKNSYFCNFQWVWIIFFCWIHQFWNFVWPGKFLFSISWYFVLTPQLFIAGSLAPNGFSDVGWMHEAGAMKKLWPPVIQTSGPEEPGLFLFIQFHQFAWIVLQSVFTS